MVAFDITFIFQSCFACKTNQATLTHKMTNNMAKQARLSLNVALGADTVEVTEHDGRVDHIRTRYVSE